MTNHPSNNSSKDDAWLDEILQTLAKECWRIGKRNRALSIDGNYGVTLIPAKAAIQAHTEQQIKKARIDELESNRDLVGFNIGGIVMTKDDVDDRIAELQSNKDEQ